MLVKVKFLKEIEYVGEVISVDKLPVQAKLPTYSKFGDACMDVYAIAYEYDQKNDRFIYHTGLAFAIGQDKVTINKMSIRPRSNLTKSDFYIPNAPGTLDFGYRGELLICFKNRTSTALAHVVERLVLHLNPSSLKTSLLKAMNDILDKQNPPYIITDDCRVAQIEVEPTCRVQWDVVDELDETERGAGGFGSTGSAAK